MGTRLNIVIIDRDKPKCETTWESVVSTLQRLNKMLNRFDPDSEVSFINRNAFVKPIKTTSEMWEILQACRYYYQQTCALFDITLKDFSKVAFNAEDRSVLFSYPELAFDLGGFAKGYALDKIKGILLDAQILHCLVDFGNSSILGVGKHPYGNSWVVSVENPFNANEILTEITLKDTSLSISGNTTVYTDHIVYPKFGKVIQERKLTCITADSPLDSEVLSTTFMIASPDEKKQLIEKFDIKKWEEYKL